MTRYIIALLADDPRCFTEYAQRFADSEAGYLLGENALPHVTLVQFNGAQDDFDAIMQYLQIMNVRTQPRILGMHFGLHKTDTDLLWAALSVARDPEVVELHENLVEFLEQRRDVEILTSKRDLFDPHITLALHRGNIPACPTPLLNTVSFSLAAGITGPNGQFAVLKKVFKYQQLEKCRL